MFRIGSHLNTPELYRLEFDEAGMALRVKVWKCRWEMTKIFLTKNVDPATVSVFNSVCTIDMDSDPQWVIIQCKLPSSGNEPKNYKRVIETLRIVEALQLLFQALQTVLAVDRSDSTSSQRTEVTIVCSREHNSFGISACLGQEVRTFVETRDNTLAGRRITTLMQHVSQSICPQDDELLKLGIYAIIPKNRRIIFECWGNACTLRAYDPDDSEYGINLLCHDVHSPLQVLILFVGLVGLCEEFEKSSV